MAGGPLDVSLQRRPTGAPLRTKQGNLTSPLGNRQQTETLSMEVVKYKIKNSVAVLGDR